MSDLGSALAITGGVILFVLLIIVGAYLLGAFATRRVLLYFGHERPWMAFIPVVSTIACVQCMQTDAEGNVALFGQNIKRDIFQWYPLITIVVAFVPVIGSLVSTVANIIANAHMYKDLLSAESGQDEAVLAWVSAFIPIVWLVLCYVKFNRNKY